MTSERTGVSPNLSSGPELPRAILPKRLAWEISKVFYSAACPPTPVILPGMNCIINLEERKEQK